MLQLALLLSITFVFGCLKGQWGREKGRRVEETGARCIHFLSDERKTGEGHDVAVPSSM